MRLRQQNYRVEESSATSARLNTPWGVALDPSDGDVLIADTFNTPAAHYRVSVWDYTFLQSPGSGWL